MNLVDAVVTKVLGDPEKKHGKWFIEVEYNSYGRLSEQYLMFDTKEEAEKVEPGHEFLT